MITWQRIIQSLLIRLILKDGAVINTCRRRPLDLMQTFPCYSGSLI